MKETSSIFYPDERVREKLFMSSPVYIVSFTIGYLLLTFASMKFMKKNPKYVIDTKVPNIMLIVFFLIMTGYLLVKLVKYMLWSNYDFQCMAVDMTEQPEVLEVILI